MHTLADWTILQIHDYILKHHPTVGQKAQATTNLHLELEKVYEILSRVRNCRILDTSIC